MHSVSSKAQADARQENCALATLPEPLTPVAGQLPTASARTVARCLGFI